MTAAWTPDAGSTVDWYVGPKLAPAPVVVPDVFVNRLLPEGALMMPFMLVWNGALTPL